MDLTSERARCRGLIPVAITSPAHQLRWLDLGGYHCYEGFFHQSLASYAALREAPPRQLLTPLDVLCSVPLHDCLSPRGLIFHAGRCGSTLLTKILARSRANLVVSEAPPHNQIWRALANDAPAGVDLYRNLILAMGRRRLPSYRAHIIKFTSWNILRFEQIRAAFPGVPALFLFRDPAAILASCALTPPGWIGRDLGIARSLDSTDTAVEAFLRAAFSIADKNFRCLDYANLRPDFLPAILRFFGLEPSPSDIRLMEAEFAWDAKSGPAPRLFKPAGRTRALPASSSLIQLCAQLRRRAEADWNAEANGNQDV